MKTALLAALASLVLVGCGQPQISSRLPSDEVALLQSWRPMQKDMLDSYPEIRVLISRHMTKQEIDAHLDPSIDIDKRNDQQDSWYIPVAPSQGFLLHFDPEGRLQATTPLGGQHEPWMGEYPLREPGARPRAELSEPEARDLAERLINTAIDSKAREIRSYAQAGEVGRVRGPELSLLHSGDTGRWEFSCLVDGIYARIEVLFNPDGSDPRIQAVPFER